MVRRRRGRGSGRPVVLPLDPSIKRLIPRMGGENPQMGLPEGSGGLVKAGIDTLAIEFLSTEITALTPRAVSVCWGNRISML